MYRINSTAEIEIDQQEKVDKNTQGKPGSLDQQLLSIIDLKTKQIIG